MSTYFNVDWFYEKFILPDCRIRVDDREYTVEVGFHASEEDQQIGRIPVDEVELELCVGMPELDPCVIIAGVEDEDDPLDDDASAAALLALKRVMREQRNCGLASYWFGNVDKDDPGYRPLTEKENEKVRNYLAHRMADGPLCKNAQDAIYTIEFMCKLIVDELDTYKEGDPLLSDYLVCFTELRREIRRNGLPTIADENMYYEIVMNREAVFVQLCHVRIEYSLHKLLSLYDKDSDDNDYAIIPYRTTLYSVPFPVLSCAAFAKRCGVNQGTVRQWIRRGKIRSAFKSGRDWMIPATTKPPGRGFVPGHYYLTSSVPAEAVAQYPFLKALFRRDYIMVDKAGGGKFHVMKNQINDKTIIATLTQEEREKFEYFLLEADWIECELDHKIVLTQIRPSENT